MKIYVSFSFPHVVLSGFKQSQLAIFDILLFDFMYIYDW